MALRLAVALTAVLACNGSNPPLIGDCSDCTGPVLVSGGGPLDASCGLTSTIPACASCLAASCCAADQVCSANTNCVALAQCLATCAETDAALCTDYCLETDDGGGITPYQTLSTCVQTDCNVACQ